jgi:hypothetical protein
LDAPSVLKPPALPVVVRSARRKSFERKVIGDFLLEPDNEEHIFACTEMSEGRDPVGEKYFLTNYCLVEILRGCILWIDHRRKEQDE